MGEFRVIIIGGGLTGACLANGLLNHADVPIRVTVFERDPPGSGFDACLTKDQLGALMPIFGRSGGSLSSAPTIFDSKMNLLMELSKLPEWSKSAPISRARLRDFLQAPLREKKVIVFGKSFTKFEVLDPNEPHSVIRVHLNDGSSQDCDVLVAADGYTGKCSLPWSTMQKLPRPLIEKGTVMCSSDSMIFFSAAYLPDNLDKTQVSGHPTKPDDYDESQASLMADLAWPRGKTDQKVEDGAEKKKGMMDKMSEADWHPDFLKIVDAIDPKTLYIPQQPVANDTPVDCRKKLLADENKGKTPELGNPRVWLMGDAIHPMFPSRGMGANQALHDTEDALYPLLELARKAAGNVPVENEDVVRGLAKYEEKMIPRSFEWVKKSSDARKAIPIKPLPKGI
ncbi:FAD/NAD(P)-binding domain-containing protein [Tothia fuscella]|uniref:FAD/NAD(P)-binding domain-containing protein n=1 Tax=Tothia fuscella TaxID=1048955 RepID=A0A9P4TY99_9PEZI|nr:FAD/NAD(P)-binding domain-containing protein [Tothia fuscella]